MEEETIRDVVHAKLKFPFIFQLSAILLILSVLTLIIMPMYNKISALFIICFGLFFLCMGLNYILNRIIVFNQDIYSVDVEQLQARKWPILLGSLFLIIGLGVLINFQLLIQLIYSSGQITF